MREGVDGGDNSSDGVQVGVQSSLVEVPNWVQAAVGELDQGAGVAHCRSGGSGRTFWHYSIN